MTSPASVSSLGTDTVADAMTSGVIRCRPDTTLRAVGRMMAEHRVVVLRDAQGMGQRARDVVEAAVKSPEPGLVLVVSASIPSGSKAKFYDELKKRAVSVEFNPLTADDAPGWLMEEARTVHGVELDSDAARAIVSSIPGSSASAASGTTSWYCTKPAGP